MKKQINRVIIVLLYKHFENKDYVIMGIDELKKQNYDVEIWVCCGLTYNDRTIVRPKGCYSGSEVTYINTKLDFEDAINVRNMSKAFFIIYPGEAYDEISNYIRKRIKVNRGWYANYYYPMTLYSGINIENRIGSPVQAIGYYVNRWKADPQRIYEDVKMLVKTFRYPSTYEFLQGEFGYSSLKNKFFHFHKKSIVLHSFDYDEMLRNRNKRTIYREKRYAVYIDGFLAGHSDIKKAGARPQIADPERYYRELNDFFSLVERKYDCEVVIALHPKAEYSTNPFGGRKLYEGKTEELIRNSFLCIFHQSTVYAYMLMYKKAYFQILTTDLRHSDMVQKDVMEWQIKGLSVIADVSQLNEENIDSYLNHYNEKKYSDYIRLFVKPKGNINKINMYIIGKLIGKL